MSSTNRDAANPTNKHPSVDILTDFANGRLDESRLVDIETHLDHCPSCCQSLAELSRKHDRFVTELVSAGKSNEREDFDSIFLDGAEGSSHFAAWPMPPETPRNIGRFVVRKEIGRGGFGVVLLAYDPRLRRDVALKVPRLGSFLTNELRERFLREAQAVAALDHPHILPIHEAGEADGIFYIASGYCRGSNLAVWLRQQSEPVGFDLAAQLVAVLADAVQHAHSRGVLHRDLKPSNVLLETRNEDGRSNGEQKMGPSRTDRVVKKQYRSNLDPLSPRITDFGLAKLDSDHPDATCSNVIMGTAGYMSPEQAGGRAKDASAATDVYSLGAILYELLTGRTPFGSDLDLATLMRVQVEEPISPARLRSKLPRDLETICLTCLRKDPRRRYNSALALADDLRNYLHGQPIQARPIRQIERYIRWCRRKPALASLSMSVLVLLAVLVIGSVVSTLSLREQQQQTFAQLTETVKAKTEAEAAGWRAVQEEQAAKRELFGALISEARARRLAGRSGQKLDSLNALSEAAELARSIDVSDADRLGLRNEVIACLPLTDVRVDRTWPGYPLGSARTGIAFDANMQRYAKIDSDGRLVVRRMEDNVELWSVNIDAPSSRPRMWWLLLKFSPDGKYLAARGQYWAGHPKHMVPTRVWDLRTTEAAIVSLPPGRQDEVWDLDFSPNGESLAVARQDGSVARIELASQETYTLLSKATSPHLICFDPTGSRLAACQESRTLIVNAETGHVALELPHRASIITWSRDGERVATGDGKNVIVWNSRDGQQVSRCSSPQSTIVFASFLPQSSTLATTSWADTRLWNAVDGRQLLVVEQGNAAQFSRDGRWLGLGSAGSKVGRFSVASPEGFRTLNQKVDGRLEVSPDGRLLVAANSGQLLFWDLKSGQLIGVVQAPQLEGLRHARFDSDGQSLFTGSAIGLHQWPLRRVTVRPAGSNQLDPTDDTIEEFVIGPPELLKLTPPMEIREIFRGADGRLLISDGYQVRVVDVSQDQPKTLRRIRHGGWWMAGSDDGRWLATSRWQAHGIRIWDLDSGRRILSLDGVNAQIAFRPKRQTLIVGNPGRYEFYEPGSWKLLDTMECVEMGVGLPVSFSRDGELLAISTDHESIKLLDGTALAEFGTFVAPGMPRLNEIHVSPEGNRLIAKSDTGVIYIWDLQVIRDRLKQMGLDWKQPEFERTSASNTQPSSMPTTNWRVELGELLDVERYTKQIDTDGGNSSLLYRRGLAYARLNRWAQALDDFTTATSLDPENFEARFQMGLVQNRLGRSHQALESFTRVIELSADHAEAHHQRGHLRQNQNDWAAALADYARASDLDLGNWNLHWHCGEMLGRLQRWGEAVERYTEAIELAEDNWDRSLALSGRAIAYLELNRFELAIADGEAALEADPENYLRSHALAWGLAALPNHALHDPERAVQLALRSIELYRQNRAAWNVLGLAYYRHETWDNALEALEESMNLHGGGDSFDWFLVAMVHWQMGNLEQARRWQTKAISWMEENNPTDRILQGLRNELEALIKPVRQQALRFQE